MTMTDWAEREIAAACKKENPNWDGESFDYGCSCYQSALKAYKSIMEDGHSGFSYNITRQILRDLLWEIPLSPITDEDFFSVERGTEEFPMESDDYLKERGLKSHLQCPRRGSLFRYETLDGKVSYHDNDRAYCVNIENPRDCFSGSPNKIVDELFPITMPYTPSDKTYKIYVQEFLTDEKLGDYDTQGIIYIETPEGNRVDVNRYYTETNGGWHSISKEEYDELLKKRIR